MDTGASAEGLEKRKHLGRELEEGEGKGGSCFGMGSQGCPFWKDDL